MTDRKPLLTGWKKDKYDRRDFLYRPRAVAIPDKMSLLPVMPAVRDQGQVGACVGFGIGANLTALAAIAGVDTEWFSPTWIYNGARFIEGSLPYDVGCYPRNALKWLADKGCLREHLWPFNPNRLDKTSPPSTLEPFADDWPILTYTRITGGADGIIAAIADGHPVSIGNPWYDDWMFTNAAGALSPVTQHSLPAGGHETIIYGYDKPAGYFLCQNSWGVNWGNRGRFLMPMSSIAVFQYHGGYDAHTIDVEWNAEPASGSDINPHPTPKPAWPWIVGAIVVTFIAILIIAL